MEIPQLDESRAFISDPDQILVDPYDGDFETITNRFLIDNGSKFIQLRIEQE